VAVRTSPANPGKKVVVTPAASWPLAGPNTIAVPFFAPPARTGVGCGVLRIAVLTEDRAPFGQPAQLDRFYGIEGDPHFRGGVRAALGDLNGDQTPDLIVSAGYSGGPRIAIFNGVDLAAGAAQPRHLVPDFYAFETTLRNGTFVAAGDINGDGKAELAFGGGPSGSDRVRIFDAAQLLAAPPFQTLDAAPSSAQLDNFFTGDPSLRGGVHLAIRPIDNTGKAALITGSGSGEHSRIQVYRATTLLANPAPSAPDQVIDPFGEVLADGVFVG
jgi:hypothetical protein